MIVVDLMMEAVLKIEPPIMGESALVLGLVRAARNLTERLGFDDVSISQLTDMLTKFKSLDAAWNAEWAVLIATFLKKVEGMSLGLENPVNSKGLGMKALRNRFFLQEDPESAINQSKEKIAALENSLDRLQIVVSSLKGCIIPDIRTLRQKYAKDTVVEARTIARGRSYGS